MAVSRTAATTSAAMERRTGSSQSIAYLLLKPILLLAFALLHITYHLILITRQTGISIQNAIRRPPTRPPASFTSLEDLLSAHDQPRDTIRIPDHLAVVLADTAPSSIRLYLSTLFTRMRQPEARSGQTDTWNEFRMRYEAAVEAKRVSDAAAVIHLARVCGVKKVSVYTSGAMPMVAVEALCGTLRVGYKTKAVVQGAEVALDAEGIEVGSWSRYTGLRKRSNASKSSDSSTGSPASSDSEAGPSSLDETLASSFTADHDAQDSTDATVDIRIGLHPSPQDSPESEPNLQVTLLHSQDGQQRFSEIVSSHIRALASTYLSTTLLPDMASSSTQKRFSASSCRKSWIAKRNLFTSQLTVSQLDDALMQEGYLDEPDLLVVWGAQRGGRTKKLYGFPAWPLRVTDLLFDRSGGRGGYGGGQFVAALRQLGKMEQRFGR
ncbi:Ditrans,polycis-polyprenyl diphosphate synthase ((2E,6E)-farnesyldiphosphate specific) [Pseudozyma hubeiensis]|nr:Ditrans,polycis-polyprenyl diphosphate synthase ((2E,6E)-farnesyldiphosphate specific) [Pseudozyma hubeiensis]